MTSHFVLTRPVFSGLIVLAGYFAAADPAAAGIAKGLSEARTAPRADAAAHVIQGDIADGSALSHLPNFARAEVTDSSRDSRTPRLNVRVGNHEKYIRIVFDWPATVTYELLETDRKVTITFARDARIDLDRLRARLGRGLTNPQARTQAGRLEFTIEKPQALEIRHFLSGPKVVLDFGEGLSPSRAAQSSSSRTTREQAAPKPKRPATVAQTAGDTEKGANAGSKKHATEPGAKALAGGNALADKTKSSQAGLDATLTFEFPEMAGAAVFRREPYIWIVFDRPIKPPIEAMRRATVGLSETIEQLPVENGAVVRIRPKPGVNPQVERSGNTWLVRLRRWPLAPQSPIAVQVRGGDTGGAEVLLPVSEPRQIIRMRDPVVGDALLIATLRVAGQGIPGRRRYPQFDLLPSAQGIVLKPLDDDVDLRDVGARGIAVTRTKGLYLSPVTETGAYARDLGSPRVFDFVNWSQGPAGNYDSALQSAIRASVEAPEGRRDEARLELARLYFAHGMAAESLGVLRSIEFTRSPLAAQPEFRALKAATQVYMGRHTDARKDLLDARLDKYPEMALWRASMYFLAGETERAAVLFQVGDAVLRSYPDPYRTKFALQRIEAGIDALDVANARKWANRLGRRADRLARQDLARLRYYQGVLAREERDLVKAVEYWNQVKETKDRWSSTRAEFALVDLELQQESITPDEAIHRLERLSYQWRGDDLELSVLDRLGMLYLGKGDYRRALDRMRTAVTYFPEKDASKAIARRMDDTFRSLYLRGKADTLPPLKALALFDDFREFTPVGQDGDKIIQNLVDRLIGADLLDRAAGLLANHVRFRLKGPDKAESGAKLALIHLLDRNPKAALSALDASHLPNPPRRVADDRRRIRAKAKLDLGRSEEAIALLADDVSVDADLLRLDIYWNASNYTEAATVLQRRAGKPLRDGTYGPDQARYILGWAVALRLKRDEAGLKMVSDQYGVGMAKSPLAETFAFVVQSADGNSEEIESIARRVIGIAGNEEFLRNYRDRLMPPTTAISTEKTLQGEDGAASEKGRKIPPPPAPGG